MLATEAISSRLQLRRNDERLVDGTAPGHFDVHHELGTGDHLQRHRIAHSCDVSPFVFDFERRTDTRSGSRTPYPCAKIVPGTSDAWKSTYTVPLVTGLPSSSIAVPVSSKAVGATVLADRLSAKESV